MQTSSDEPTVGYTSSPEPQAGHTVEEQLVEEVEHLAAKQAGISLRSPQRPRCIMHHGHKWV